MWLLLNLFLLIFLYINIQHKMIAIAAHNVTEKIIISVTVDVLFVCTEKVYCVESLVGTVTLHCVESLACTVILHCVESLACTVTLHCVESLTIKNDKFLIISFKHFSFLLQLSSWNGNFDCNMVIWNRIYKIIKNHMNSVAPILLNKLQNLQLYND